MNEKEKIKFGEFLKCVELYTPLRIDLMGYKDDMEKNENGSYNPYYQAFPRVISSLDYITRRNIFDNFSTVDDDLCKVNELLPDDILDYIVYNVRPIVLNITGCGEYELPPQALQVQLMKQEEAK